MSLENLPDKFRDRRQARQDAKLQRQAQQKQLYIRIGIAAVVLCLCGILIAVLVASSREATQPETQPETTIQTGETTTPVETTQPVPEHTTVVHVAAVGDLNITQAVTDSGDPETGYGDTFLDVAPVLAQADLTLLNLEGSFYGAPYGEDRSAPDSLATSLQKAGVDLIQLANSYSIYKGMDGLSTTVQTIRSAGMEAVGAYANAQEAQENGGYTIRTVKGVKIAFVAFTKGMDGMALPPGNEKCVNLLYTDYASDYQTVDTQGITKLLSAVKKEKPDITLALVHWGSEYNNTISDSQKEICQLLWDHGVDGVIGTHSHYVQQMVLDEETGNFVAYSLGDFIGDSGRAGSEYSLVLDLTLTKDNKTGKAKIAGFTYTPIYTISQEGSPLRVVRTKQAMEAYDANYIGRVSQPVYEAMAYSLERIDARIKGE